MPRVFSVYLSSFYVGLHLYARITRTGCICSCNAGIAAELSYLGTAIQ